MRMQCKVRSGTSLILLLCGLCVLLYPMISNWYEEVHHGEVIRTYQDDVAQMEDEEITGAWEEAVAYNQQLQELVQLSDPFVSDFELQNLTYDQLLNENADGVMSYIEIPSINVFLPIYHGTSEGVLAKGAGHMVNTSLPVGGASTHCVISAHRGDPAATLFSHLDQLREGDEFHLYTLNEKLSYRVDHINVVLPYDTDGFGIIEGKDFVTLVTCTPYGVNSHRLLVRGERIENEPILEESEPEQIQGEERKPSFNYAACVMGGIAACLMMAAVSLCVKRKRKRGDHGKM